MRSIPLLLALAAPALPQDPDAPPTEDPARALFVEHCAQCHGLTGDGKGWTELDRPARSFLDGGFSYGNTREAVVRSLRYGIPGTPMPAFPDEVLSASQREALADFVIGLGPEGTIVEPGASVLRVDDRPLVVKGMLPPLKPGGDRVPRGLLVGFPSGTTFQFRADDVRLLAVRQGEFVDRRDWGGRGGAPLQPLGRVITDLSDAPAPYRDAEGHDLRRKLRATLVVDGAVGVVSEVSGPDGELQAVVTEALRIVPADPVPVPVRTVRHTQRSGHAVAHDLLTRPDDARLEAAFRASGGATWHVHRVADGVFRVQPAASSATPELLHFVHAPRWSPALERALAALPEATR